MPSRRADDVDRRMMDHAVAPSVLVTVSHLAPPRYGSAGASPSRTRSRASLIATPAIHAGSHPRLRRARISSISPAGRLRCLALSGGGKTPSCRREELGGGGAGGGGGGLGVGGSQPLVVQGVVVGVAGVDGGGFDVGFVGHEPQRRTVGRFDGGVDRLSLQPLQLGDAVVGILQQRFELGGAGVELRVHLTRHLLEFDEQVRHLALDRALLG